MINKIYRLEYRSNSRTIDEDYLQYAKVYKDSVMVLLEHLKTTGYDHDYQVLPLLFLFRHYIELKLKGLIRLCLTISPDNRDIKKNHDLNNLLDEFKSIDIPKIKFDIKNKLFIKKFNEVDKADRFRYPEDKNGNLYYGPNDIFYHNNKAFFDELMQLSKLSIHIENIINELENLESYIEGEREEHFKTIEYEQEQQDH